MNIKDALFEQKIELDDSMDDDNIIIMIDFEGNSNLDMY